MPQETDSLVSFKELITFTCIFLLFILSWISVAVVGRALDNFTFSTLKLNERSTYHTVVIAVVIVIIEILAIYYFNDNGISLYNPYLKPKNGQQIIKQSGNNIDPNTGFAPFFGVSELFEVNGVTII